MTDKMSVKKKKHNAKQGDESINKQKYAYSTMNERLERQVLR